MDRIKNDYKSCRFMKAEGCYDAYERTVIKKPHRNAASSYVSSRVRKSCYLFNQALTN